MRSTRHGTYTTGVDGLPELRFVRRFDCDAARLWKAVTVPQALGGWFGTTKLSDTDFGRFEVTSENSDPQTGIVIVCEPPHAYQVTWDDPPHPPGKLFVEVVGTRTGSQLVLTHRGVMPALVASYDSRWNAHLDKLTEYLGGRSPERRG